MSLPWPATDTILVYKAGTTQDYGNEVLDWTTSELVEEIPGCSVQSMPGPEISLEREAILSRWLVFVPDYHPRLNGTLRVEIPFHVGKLMIEGDTPYFSDPTGAGLDHHEFYLKEVNG